MSRAGPGRTESTPKRGPEPSMRQVVFAFAVLAIVSFAFMTFATRRFATRTPAAAPDAATYEGLPAAGRLLGEASAPVTIVEYSDFRCPYCRVAAGAILGPLKKEYIRTGRVRFLYQPVAFLGPESIRAAEAAMCAEDQGRFWPYHDRLFAAQVGETRSAFDDSVLKHLAADLGLDRTRFNACLDRGRHRRDVEAVNREARALGVNGTPTFFIDGVKVVGAVPYGRIREIVEGRAK